MRRLALPLLFLGAAATAGAAKGPYSVSSHTRLGYYANAHAFDAAIFEPSRKELYYVRGNSLEVRVVERMHGESVVTIPLDGYPSYAVADPPRNRVLVRLYDRDLIQVIDTNAHRDDAETKLVTDSEGFGRAGSPDTTTATRISSLLTLPYKSDFEPRPRSH